MDKTVSLSAVAPAIWRHRWLLWNLTVREVRNRYVGSFTGAFWALLHPLAILGIYAVVFTAIFRVKFPAPGGHEFITFVAVGLWPWLIFQEGVQRGTLAVQNNAGLVKKAAFPHQLLVYSAVFSTLGVHLLGYLLVLLALSVFLTSLHLEMLPLLALLLGAQLVLAMALALALSSLQVLFRDVEQFLAPLFMVWFYATPVLYPTELVPDWLKSVIALNPMAYFVERARTLVMAGDWMPRWEDLIALAFCLLVFALARGLFSRLSPHFEDFL